MKKSSPVHPVPYRPTEKEIREKALEFYASSGWIRDRDLDNWLAAERFLLAHPPVQPVRAFTTRKSA